MNTTPIMSTHHVVLGFCRCPIDSCVARLVDAGITSVYVRFSDSYTTCFLLGVRVGVPRLVPSAFRSPDWGSCGLAQVAEILARGIQRRLREFGVTHENDTDHGGRGYT